MILKRKSTEIIQSKNRKKIEKMDRGVETCGIPRYTKTCMLEVTGEFIKGKNIYRTNG